MAEIHVKEVRAATALHVDAGISDRVLRFDLRSIGVEIPEVSPFVANVQFPRWWGPSPFWIHKYGPPRAW